MNRPLLILDLDETIVWATEEEPYDGFDFRTTRYFVKKRPHLEEFLRTVRQWYDLAVWSSSGDGYASQVVHNVFGDGNTLRFAWGRSRCTEGYDEETRELGELAAKGELEFVAKEPTLEDTFTIDTALDFLHGKRTWADLTGMSLDEAFALAQFGYDFYKEARFEEARIMYEGLVITNPYEPYFHGMLGVIYRRLDRPEDAVTIFSRTSAPP